LVQRAQPDFRLGLTDRAGYELRSDRRLTRAYYRPAASVRANSDVICRSSFQDMSRDEKFIERDRKIADTLPGRVINCVSNCCWDSGYHDLAGPTGSNWVENRVRLTDKLDIDMRNVGVSSY
jgi:hypothetical protein